MHRGWDAPNPNANQSINQSMNRQIVKQFSVTYSLCNFYLTVLIDWILRLGKTFTNYDLLSVQVEYTRNMLNLFWKAQGKYSVKLSFWFTLTDTKLYLYDWCIWIRVGYYKSVPMIRSFKTDLHTCVHAHTPTHSTIHKHACTCVFTHAYFSLSMLVHVI